MRENGVPGLVSRNHESERARLALARMVVLVLPAQILITKSVLRNGVEFPPLGPSD